MFVSNLYSSSFPQFSFSPFSIPDKINLIHFVVQVYIFLLFAFLVPPFSIVSSVVLSSLLSYHLYSSFFFFRCSSLFHLSSRTLLHFPVFSSPGYISN